MKKTSGGVTTRFVYGPTGALIAEYQSGALSKEYIYGASGLLAVADVTASRVEYPTPDHLGTPRIVTSGTSGSATVLSRHDYYPFGRELFADAVTRTTAQGYPANLTASQQNDHLRRQFTSQERDAETGLDYFGARYFASTQGRFTGVDPVMIPDAFRDPQSWNKYAYTLNNPLRYVDPSGAAPQDHAERLMDKDVEEFLAGKIDAKEMSNRQMARGVGAAIGLGIVAGVALAPEAIETASVYAATHVALVEGLSLAFADAATGGGPSGFGPSTFVAPTIMQAESRIVQNAANGGKFENFVLGLINLPKNTKTVPAPSGKAAFRIPDILSDVKKLLGDIKGVKELYLSSQFKDFIAAAKQKSYTFYLYVRPDTTLTKDLVNELKKIGARVYNVAKDGTITRRKL